MFCKQKAERSKKRAPSKEKNERKRLKEECFRGGRRKEEGVECFFSLFSLFLLLVFLGSTSIPSYFISIEIMDRVEAVKAQVLAGT